ncbi:iron-sulfur cluster biosynthesis family protein [Metabacillus arenae]|uniref:Iron-sulfur cluster biosynthesis family protein n=1 Tax=Metabacillus arenae TaxID=2771434 RepID=A0A926NDA3_9BACI|nr:iron-sulfur cluster biosynthesis family protein [Metabacillus arenae]MBD1378735.1 iron-sulfur cluster biosynthesis family protein [Metabacillus arenae]
MQITLTDKAIQKIHEKLTENHKLKLKYDTDGCGCVVSGVTVLWAIEKEEEDDLLVETNDLPIYVEKSKMVFLDEQMTIDFQDKVNTFVLKCPSQILNPRMSFIKK